MKYDRFPGKLHKTLADQQHEVLKDKLDQGVTKSKKAAIAAGDDVAIHSYRTYQNYSECCRTYAYWIRDVHPDTVTMKKAKRYIPEYLNWLKSRMDPNDVAQGISAYTISKIAAALYKAYDIPPDDPLRVELPPRRRSDIKRSRGPAVRDANFKICYHRDLIVFEQSCGLRREELTDLRGGECVTRAELMEARGNAARLRELLAPAEVKGSDIEALMLIDDALMNPNAEFYVFVRNGKGGRQRFAPLIGRYADRVYATVKKCPTDRRVWSNGINTAYDVHSDRAFYAARIYMMYARPIDEIPTVVMHLTVNGVPVERTRQPEVYHCRGEEKGISLDKRALLIASKALGHNRVSVVAEHYSHKFYNIEGEEVTLE